jgi:hypothetical protein
MIPRLILWHWVSLLLIPGMLASAAADVVVTDLTAMPQPKSIRIEGQKADDFTRDLNRLKWDDSSGSRCHRPAYKVEVLDAEEKVIEATLSFTCGNARFTVPSAYGLKGFDEKDPAALTLRQTLQALFANPSQGR